ncbi:MAG: chromosomal replication initiator protein DnaA [Eubacteriales bacterium]|nr:chromosomal replication initiator protein DnaA [Eubacteriales bacterium]
MDELLKNWENILQTFKEEYDIQDISFKTWIKPLKLYSVDDDTVTLFVPGNKMGVSYIEKKYLQFLQITVCEVMDKEYTLRLISEEDKQKEEIKKKTITGNEQNNIVSQNLNPNYTFDTFVVGNNNNLAHAASLAVAETPGGVYNPLFIYGGVGLGKTHLMQAIAHFIIDNDPSKKVLYVTSETFTNEVINSIRNGNAASMQKVRDKYRTVDVLMIDDIQFIIGKESTQEEFFHTFNALYQDGKQIVISSDKPPKEMETLSERLRTRFEMGLPVDIQIPTYETKMAIISRKAELSGLNIPDDVKDYIASNIKSSIRELEGALTKLSAFSKLTGKPLTLEFAENTLKDLISPETKKEVTPEYIIQIVADHFNVSYDDLISSKRNADIVFPRQVAMYLCRQMTTAPLTAVGKSLGNRDHATVIHGADKISKEILTNETTRNTIDIIIKKINP